MAEANSDAVLTRGNLVLLAMVIPLMGGLGGFIADWAKDRSNLEIARSDIAALKQNDSATFDRMNELFQINNRKIEDINREIGRLQVQTEFLLRRSGNGNGHFEMPKGNGEINR